MWDLESQILFVNESFVNSPNTYNVNKCIVDSETIQPDGWTFIHSFILSINHSSSLFPLIHQHFGYLYGKSLHKSKFPLHFLWQCLCPVRWSLPEQKFTTSIHQLYMQTSAEKRPIISVWTPNGAHLCRSQLDTLLPLSAERIHVKEQTPWWRSYWKGFYSAPQINLETKRTLERIWLTCDDSFLLKQETTNHQTRRCNIKFGWIWTVGN